MEIRLLKSKFWLFLILIFGFSCQSKTENHKNKSTSIYQSKDTLIFENDVIINRIKYSKKIIYDNDRIFKTLSLNDAQSSKCIRFEETELFYKDTIFDINKDGFDDFVFIEKSTRPLAYNIYLANQNGYLSDTLSYIYFDYFPLGNRKFVEYISLRCPYITTKHSEWKGRNIQTTKFCYYQNLGLKKDECLCIYDKKHEMVCPLNDSEIQILLAKGKVEKVSNEMFDAYKYWEVKQSQKK